MRRVLILEREPFLGSLLGERFRRSGFEVKLLSQPSVPIGAPPDLLIVGAHEPGALQTLQDAAPGVPLIMLGDGVPSRSFCSTLEKPFSPNGLVELANRCLVTHKLQRDTSKKFGIIPNS
jgi:hypothetical protein